MRESRVNVWTNPTTISADGATNGPTIDLLGDYVGDHLFGTSLYGLPFEIMGYDVETGSGDGFTVTFKFQTSTDGNSWDDHAEIGTFTLDTDGNWSSGLSRGKLNPRLVTTRRYARLVATASGISGGETIKVKAWLSDGANPYADVGEVR